MFDSEQNKEHQKTLCNEVRKLSNETKKQRAIRIETLVGNPYSLNTKDFKNIKMTDIFMITLPKLQQKESDKIHKTIHKRDIADQIVLTISIEITSLDQIQIEVFSQTK